MASIQEEASGKKGGEIRYLTPLNIDHSTTKIITKKNYRDFIEISKKGFCCGKKS